MSREAVFLQRDVIVVVHAVEADDVTARKVVQEAHDKVRADETGGTRDENGFIFSIHILFTRIVFQCLDHIFPYPPH